MRDVFFTVLIVWLLWRIFSSRTVIKTFTYTNRPNPGQPEGRTGEVRIDKTVPKDKKKDDDEGEYVDYEEIKP